MQGIWRQFHAEAATENPWRPCSWLQEHEYLAWQEIGGKDDRGEGWQVEHGRRGVRGGAHLRPLFGVR